MNVEQYLFECSCWFFLPPGWLVFQLVKAGRISTAVFVVWLV